MNELLMAAAQAFISKTGSGGLDAGQVGQALGRLLGNGSGDIDIAGLVSKFAGSGLSGALDSWLGDGENSGVSGQQLKEVFSSDQLAQFAGDVGVEEDDAVDGLCAALPKLLDSASSGGSLLGSLSGGGGLGALAGKLLG